jgi:hypothetical protein
MKDEQAGGGGKTALIPEEVRIVEFYGDEITSALIHIDGEARIYVPLRPLCDFLGLSWTGQRERTMRDEVLSDVIRGVRVTRTPGPGGGTQEMLCLPLEFLPGWLFGVSTQRITKPEIRDRIILYRRECYQRLWDAFKHDILQSISAPLTTTLSGAALAYELATAVQNLAREQMEIEQRLTHRLDQAGQWARGIETRVTALELRLGDNQPISKAQSADIALSVKAVAHALEQKGTTNSYQRVYGELYRQQGIASYKSLPRSAFDEVMRWLHDWHEELTKEES